MVVDSCAFTIIFDLCMACLGWDNYYKLRKIEIKRQLLLYTIINVLTQLYSDGGQCIIIDTMSFSPSLCQ